MEYYGAGFLIQSSLDIIRHLSSSNFRFAGHHFSAFYSLPWSHLLSNTSPILVFHINHDHFYPRVATQAYLLIMVERDSLYGYLEEIHIGASGMVYGLVSYVFWTGVFRKIKIHNFRTDHHHFIFRNVCIYVSKC